MERQLQAILTDVSQYESVLTHVMAAKERHQTQYRHIKDKLATYQSHVFEHTTFPTTLDLINCTLPRLLTELQHNIQLNNAKADRIFQHLQALRLKRAELEHALKHHHSMAMAV